MTEYKKVGTKKIEGKKQPVNVYKKAGSSKLYVMHKTAKSKFMSYVNFKKMYAKKVAAKKVVKRKVVVKRRRPTSKRGGNVLYETKWGATGGEDIAMTGKDLGLSLPKEHDMDQDTDMDKVADMDQNTDVTVGGRKNRNNKNRINKSKKGGSGCGYHEAMNGGLRRRRKGGNIEDNEYNLDELLGGARGRKKSSKGKKLKGGNDDIAHTISLEDLDAMQGGNFDMEGGRRRGSMFSRRSRGRAFGRRRGGELDDLLGGAQRRRTTRKRGGDLNDLLGGARRRRTRRPKLT